MQTNINIGEINVPIIEEDGQRYYPASYIGKHILLRGKKAVMNPSIREKYKDRIIKRELVFDEDNVKESNLIREDALKEILERTRVGNLDEQKRVSQNLIHNHLGIKLLPTGVTESKYHNELEFKYDHYTKEIVDHVIKENPDIDFRMCSTCNTHLPLSNLFFKPDSRASKGYTKICLRCVKESEYIHPELAVKKLKRIRPELYKYYEEYKPYEMIDAYNKKLITNLPVKFKNRESYLNYFRSAYAVGVIEKDKLTLNYLKDKLGNNTFAKYVSMHDIYENLFGKEYYLHPWDYPSFTYSSIKMTKELAYKVFKNYLKVFSIEIKDKLNFDYDMHFKKSKLKKFANGNTLELIVFMNDMKYPGYKYNYRTTNYYKSEDNLLFDLRYLVEEDLKIPVEKIPLYLTRQVLATKVRSLYHSIITNKNGSLFHWINKLYPERFTEQDFELNPHRLEFDSEDEMFLDEILRTEFDNVLYNPRNSDKTIVIGGMIPDWLIFTDRGVVIVELYGMYEERQYGKSSRVTDYINKTNKKIYRYENEIEGYHHLFIFKSDLDNEKNGYREKVRKLKEKLDIPTV